MSARKAWADTDDANPWVSRVLLVYNVAAKDGVAVANYYKANRPGMGGVDTLAVTADTTEQTSFANMISQIRTPIHRRRFELFSHIGMACHTDEPFVAGIEGSMYMCNWEAGLLFCECAWSSRNTKHFMAVGDPLVRR